MEKIQAWTIIWLSPVMSKLMFVARIRTAKYIINLFSLNHLELTSPILTAIAAITGSCMDKPKAAQIFREL